MKVYIVMGTDKETFKQSCIKKNVKCDKMPHYSKSHVIHAIKNKKEAIDECRKWNKQKWESEFDFMLRHDTTFYIIETQLY